MSIPISGEHADNICKLGQREKVCRFLIRGETWECAKGGVEERVIRINESKMEAKGDNCSGPPNFTPTDGKSEPTPAPVPEGHVRCKSCGRVYIESFSDDYYNYTTNTDGVCEKCLFASL